ncbi:hypothetical protein CZ797_01445 [Pseudoalteromonas sp. JB197]|nr:hypothetical protein CZ797_01445 [Pseudoalteromonas sp. JB197]
MFVLFQRALNGKFYALLCNLFILGRVDLCGMKNKQHEDKV